MKQSAIASTVVASAIGHTRGIIVPEMRKIVRSPGEYMYLRRRPGCTMRVNTIPGNAARGQPAQKGGAAEDQNPISIAR